MSDLDEQHPPIVVDGEIVGYRAHCNNCGTYVEDTLLEPAADYLCDDCEDWPEEDDDPWRRSDLLGGSPRF